jgi:hypothetical protein
VVILPLQWIVYPDQLAEVFNNMAINPNESKIVYGIVVGGNDKDPDPTQSGGCRIYLPSEYGKDVDIKHLPFSRNSGQGTQNGITNFNPPPEHGSAVLCMKVPGHSGTGHLTILQTVPNDINKDSTVPGNSAGIWPAIEKAIKDVTSIRIPPTAGSGPAGSKPPKEKGDYHRHELVKFIPSTGTLWPMNGMPIPQMTNVTTAVQAFSGILSGNLLSMLPGMNMTLGSLFSNMPGDLLNQLLKNLPPEIAGAATAMTNLMQTMEINEAGGFNTATKINPAVYFNNAANVIADSRTIYDLVGSFQRLQHDTSLFGLDSLPPVNVTMAGGPFGDVPMQIDALGNITSLMPDSVKQLADTFSSLMGDGAGFPGVFPGANMFGGSSGVLNEMFNRLPNTELNKAVKQMQNNVAPGMKTRDSVNKMAGFAMTGVKLGRSALKKVKG